MKLGSLFDGSGGFPLAGALNGIEPVWASEVEPYPIAVTTSRFPRMKHLGDVSKVNGAEIEPVDIITFGSPCQDMSVAGKRAGIKHEDHGDEETTRSGLFYEAIRIIKEMRYGTEGRSPTFVVWENVPGAFSSNRGEDFRAVLEELVKVAEPTAVVPDVPKSGWAYADCWRGDGWSLAYRVFDAQYLRTAQRRKRIYLVLCLGDEDGAGKILFERDRLRGHYPQSGKAWERTPTPAEGSLDAEDRNGVIIGVDIYNQSLTGDKSKTLNSAAVYSDHIPCVIKEQFLFENHSQDSRYKGPLDVCPMLPAQLGTGGNNQPFVVEQTLFCKSRRAKRAGDATMWKEPRAVCYGIGNGQTNQSYSEEQVGTLNCMHDQQAVAVPAKPYYIVRRITPTECARLQGFPDRWGDIDHKEAMTADDFAFWLEVKQTYDRINGRAKKDYTEKQILAWYNKLHNDGAEYKMWGNGIALPCALYVMEGIVEVAT